MNIQQENGNLNLLGNQIFLFLCLSVVFRTVSTLTIGASSSMMLQTLSSCPSVQQQQTWPSWAFLKGFLVAGRKREQASPAVPARRLHYRCVVNYSGQHIRRGWGGVVGVRR